MQSEYCGKLATLIDKFCVNKLGDLSKATMRLALGRFESSPFTETDLDELRKEWFKLLPSPVEASMVPPDQPFLLHAVAQSLRLMGDPDVDIIDGKGESSFADGVHLGPLGRTGLHKFTDHARRSPVTTSLIGPSIWTTTFAEVRRKLKGSLQSSLKKKKVRAA